MNKFFYALLFSVIIFLNSCSSSKENKVFKDYFAPPKVTVGKPIAFPESFDITPWKKKSKQADIWFKKNNKGHWYIDWDAERREFTKIIIHHSASKSDLSNQEISDIHYNRLYKPIYNIKSLNDPHMYGLKIHSHHVINGRETFCAYHHLVYSDGRVTTELKPLRKINGKWFIDMVGWHAGNWKVNCESIAICLVGDYSESIPGEKQLESVKRLINYYRKLNKNLQILPHKHVNKKTSCPGNKWQEWFSKIK